MRALNVEKPDALNAGKNATVAGTKKKVQFNVSNDNEFDGAYVNGNGVEEFETDPKALESILANNGIIEESLEVKRRNASA